MKKLLLLLIIPIFSLSSLQLPIRQLAKISSLRQNQLIGYGLVVGLPQTGDSRTVLAQNALRRLLNYKGIKITEKDLKSKNIAAVMVMAKVPAFASAGGEIDIWVSSIGDAKSLKDGYLLQTPLMGGDGKIYAVAQASVTSNSKSSSSTQSTSRFGNRRISQRHKSGGNKFTTVHIPRGAIMEQTVNQPLAFIDKQTQERFIRLRLLHFDIGTAQKVIDGINAKFGGSASLNSNGGILVKIPKGQVAPAFVNQVFEIPVEVSHRAKVIIDPRSATIVMGENVGLSTVAISKNGINIKIEDKRQAREVAAAAAMLPETPNVAQLVAALNALGLKAEDIIDILKAIHAAGALHGELVIL